MIKHTVHVVVRQGPEGVRYVRIHDLPKALQDNFISYLRGAAMPVVSDEAGPIAYEVDWLDWLHGRRSDRN